MEADSTPIATYDNPSHLDNIVPLAAPYDSTGMEVGEREVIYAPNEVTPTDRAFLRLSGEPVRSPINDEDLQIRLAAAKQEVANAQETLSRVQGMIANRRIEHAVEQARIDERKKISWEQDVAKLRAEQAEANKTPA